MKTRLNLGDIVTMPLPEQWMPDIETGGVPPAFGRVVGPAVPSQAGYGPGYVAGGGLPQGGQSATGLMIPPATVNPAARGNWTPDAVLPDSMLPPALQRSNPLLRRSNYFPTRWDQKMLLRAQWFTWIAKHGGLKSCCRIPELGAPIWEQPPWQVMPSQGIEYREVFSRPVDQISAGPPFNGVDTILGQWQVPLGYDGVLNQFACGYTGGGFVDFSGDIIWRVRVDNRYARNLGQVLNAYASNFQNAFVIPGYGIRLVSGQTITLIANIPAGSPVIGGNVFAGVFGWNYPRR